MIIGDKPRWIKNVSHIPFKDDNRALFKSKNIFDKISLIDEEFIFFNDDHYLLRDFDKRYYYSGTMKTELNRGTNGCYRTTKNTLEKFGNIKNFDIHCPIVYKPGVLKLIKKLDWTKPGGYCIKSIYCALEGIEGVEYPDNKVYNDKSVIDYDLFYFSSANGALSPKIISILDTHFPLKSQYEL